MGHWIVQSGQEQPWRGRRMGGRFVAESIPILAVFLKPRSDMADLRLGE